MKTVENKADFEASKNTETVEPNNVMKTNFSLDLFVTPARQNMSIEPACTDPDFTPLPETTCQMNTMSNGSALQKNQETDNLFSSPTSKNLTRETKDLKEPDSVDMLMKSVSEEQGRGKLSRQEMIKLLAGVRPAPVISSQDSNQAEEPVSIEESTSELKNLDITQESSEEDEPPQSIIDLRTELKEETLSCHRSFIDSYKTWTFVGSIDHKRTLIQQGTNLSIVENFSWLSSVFYQYVLQNFAEFKKCHFTLSFEIEIDPTISPNWNGERKSAIQFKTIPIHTCILLENVETRLK